MQRVISRQLGNYYANGAIGQGVDGIPGDLIAPLDDGFQDVRNNITDYVGQSRQFDSGIASTIQRLLSGEPTQNVDKQFTDDYFGAVTTKSQYDFQNFIRPQIALSGGPGALLSSRAGHATSQALTGIQNDLNVNYANARRQDQLYGVQLKEAALERARGAIPVAEAFANRGLSRGAGLASLLQGTFQGRADQTNAARIAEFLRTRPEANPNLALAQQYSNLDYLTAYPKSSGSIGGALAGAGIGGLIAGIVAAPFTGGASLALAAAAGAASGASAGYSGGYSGALVGGATGGLTAGIGGAAAGGAFSGGINYSDYLTNNYQNAWSVR